MGGRLSTARDAALAAERALLEAGALSWRSNGEGLGASGASAADAVAPFTFDVSIGNGSHIHTAWAVDPAAAASLRASSPAAVEDAAAASAGEGTPLVLMHG